MSLNHGSVAAVATHVPQTLPSFAQAFSTQSLGSISSGNNSLPPIQTRLTAMDNRRVHSRSRPTSEENTRPNTVSKKRLRNDVTSNPRDDGHSDPEHGSPRLVQIKEEQDQDPHTLTRTMDRLPEEEAGAPPPSSLLPPPSKKRRVTISGAPHPLNTDVRVPVDQTNSTPISPVVMGFKILRDHPAAFEHVRSIITVKQKQKALIEQRRGSVAAAPSPSVVTGNSVPPPPIEDRASSKAPNSTRPLRCSPHMGTSSRRIANNQVTGNAHPPSPSPIIVPSQQPIQVSGQVSSADSLPPPPISFARRRAGQMGAVKRKPADILISPRETQTPDQFQPAIQSAPPVHGSFYTRTGPMALPRLPSMMGGGDNVRRVAGNVPPTPTRLSMQRNASSFLQVNPPTSVPAGRSPPAASVPIASTLVPPTPSSLHRPGYAGDKSAFLAPFELFYDALNDSKQLKTWLGEQLQKSSALMQALSQQQEKLNEMVESMVEKRVSGMRSEVAGLHRRVEELEDALRTVTPSQRPSTDAPGDAKSKGKLPFRNGSAGSLAPETYTFPPVPVPPTEPLRMRPEPPRGRSSPGWGHDLESREPQAQPAPESGSPVLRSVSASATQQRPAFVQSPSLAFREPAVHGKRERERVRQPTSHSHSGGAQPLPPSKGERGGSLPPRRMDSRSNSVIISPPDVPAEES